MSVARVSSLPERLALEAEYAGSALACPFSSSDEYEAALIDARRAAGLYGPSARQRHLFWGGVAAALLAFFIVIV